MCMGLEKLREVKELAPLDDSVRSCFFGEC